MPMPMMAYWLFVLTCSPLFNCHSRSPAVAQRTMLHAGPHRLAGLSPSQIPYLYDPDPYCPLTPTISVTLTLFVHATEE